MTTIAYRDGVMAGDSGVWLNNVTYRSAIKVARGADGSLHGVAGNQGDAEGYLAWVRDGMHGKPPKPEGTDRGEGRSAFLALVVAPDGNVSLWTAYGREHHYKVPYIAVGAGSEMAVGAMAAGASAEQAIAIVADNSGYAMKPVRTIKLEQSE